MTFMALMLESRLSSLKLRLEPLYDAASGEIVGCETRWELLDDGRTLDATGLLRDAYMHEEDGLLDRWMLRSALAIAREFAHVRPGARVHADVRGITRIDPARELYRWLRALRPQAGDLALALEIDERYLLPHFETLGGFTRAVRRLGIEIVIDQAIGRPGVEEALRRVHCDAIKIDDDLVAAIEGDATARARVAGIVACAHAHGMYAIAAGVYDRETLERVRELGCDRVQGLAAFPT